MVQARRLKCPNCRGYMTPEKRCEHCGYKRNGEGLMFAISLIAAMLVLAIVVLLRG